MDNDFYINLIHKQLTGNLTAEEEDVLSAYLSSNVDHQQFADEIKLSWEFGEEVQSIPNIDVEQELNRIHLLIDRGNAELIEETAKVVPPSPESGGKIFTMIPRYLAIAASLLVLTVAGTWFFKAPGIDGIDNIETIIASNGTKVIIYPMIVKSGLKMAVRLNMRKTRRVK